MSILSTGSRLIKVGQDYSAGSGISIDNHVISVTSVPGTTYSAGDNIDIYEQDEQLYISSKDWSQDIANASANAYNEATAQIPEPFDPSYISGQVDNKLDSTAFTAWQSGQYATDLQTVEGQINNKLDTSSFSDVSGSFLTAINIPESATWNEVSQAYEQASGTYLTSVSIPESATWNDVSTTVQTNSADWASHQDLSYISGVVDNKLDESAFANVSGTFLTAHQSLDGYATEDWVTAQGYLTAHQDISNKLDTTAFSTVSGDFLTAVDLTPYATTAEVDTLSSFLSGAIDYVSANAGGEFPASANEAITAYQTNSGSYLTAISIPDSATWNDVSTTVQTNSADWGQGGGSVTSPLGTISVDGSNIEATNSAVGTIVFPAASAMLGVDIRINDRWSTPTVFNFNLPISGGTLYAVRNRWYGTDTFNFSGKDLNGNIISASMTVNGEPGTYTANLNEIVSDISAQGTQGDVDLNQLYVNSPETSIGGVHELAWKSDIPKLQDNMFTGYNTLSTAGNTYNAAIDTDIRFSANNNTYSLTGVCSTAKTLETALNYSHTILKIDNHYEIGNKAYKPDILGISAATRIEDYGGGGLYVEFRFNDWPATAKLDTVYLTFEATQSGTMDSNWSLYSNSGNQYTFVRYLKYIENASQLYSYNFMPPGYGTWGTMTNATASATVYSACDIKELAFKDDLTGQGGGGASYTAGDNIDITNNVISVNDVSNLSAGDGISITQDASYTTISWLNDAGIKNVVYTASLPATPDNNTLYLIPET